jgi:hypothetical protein
MTAVAASATAMTAVAASATAMTAVFGSGVAKKAIYDSDTAWNALNASSAARAYMLSISTVSNTTSTTHVQVNGTKRSVLIQQKSGNNSYYSYAGANADAYVTNSTAFIDRFVRITGLTHRISNSSYTSTISYISME